MYISAINMKVSYFKSPGLLFLKVLFLFFWANDDTDLSLGDEKPTTT